MSKKQVLVAATMATLGLVALTATSSSVGRHEAGQQQLSAPNLSYEWQGMDYSVADQIALGAISPAPAQTISQPSTAAPRAKQDQLTSWQKWFLVAGSREAQ